ncbi:hypothetical protein F4677DRAFT_96219 [Hypoxylon crocopeplum]|nr:hypothetical protein F4677DRAFT_96219 [Hypoxylon crocopeplum]
MNSSICNHCRTAIRQSLRLRRARQQQSIPTTTKRNSSDSASPSLETLLAKPSWSVRSLLPSPTDSPSSSESMTITPRTLHHLLRLSALPPPKSTEEESQMLSTLESQLHFVHAIRSVDTAGVEPLRAIRDETAEGLREQTIGLDQLKDVLAKEDIVGHARRPRRQRGAGQKEEGVNSEIEGWDVLSGASETAGRYFVVRTGSSNSARASISESGNAKGT